jgi:hypothetical protein
MYVPAVVFNTWGWLFCATPDRVTNCPQAVDNLVDNFIEKAGAGSNLGTLYTLK